MGDSETALEIVNHWDRMAVHAARASIIDGALTIIGRVKPIEPSKFIPKVPYKLFVQTHPLFTQLSAFPGSNCLHFLAATVCIFWQQLSGAVCVGALLELCVSALMGCVRHTHFEERVRTSPAPRAITTSCSGCYDGACV